MMDAPDQEQKLSPSPAQQRPATAAPRRAWLAPAAAVLAATLACILGLLGLRQPPAPAPQEVLQPPNGLTAPTTPAPARPEAQPPEGAGIASPAPIWDRAPGPDPARPPQDSLVPYQPAKPEPPAPQAKPSAALPIGILGAEVRIQPSDLEYMGRSRDNKYIYEVSNRGREPMHGRIVSGDGDTWEVNIAPGRKTKLRLRGAIGAAGTALTLTFQACSDRTYRCLSLTILTVRRAGW